MWQPFSNMAARIYSVLSAKLKDLDDNFFSNVLKATKGSFKCQDVCCFIKNGEQCFSVCYVLWYQLPITPPETVFPEQWIERELHNITTTTTIYIYIYILYTFIYFYNFMIWIILVWIMHIQTNKELKWKHVVANVCGRRRMKNWFNRPASNSSVCVFYG